MTDLREQLERPHSPGSPPRSYRVDRVTVGEREPAFRRRATEKLLSLNRTIETKVIPSLVTAHSCGEALAYPQDQLRPQDLRSDLATRRGDPTADDVAAFAAQMLKSDSDNGQIEALRTQGRSLEDIYLQLLAPAAMHLRRLWSDDLCGFAEATLALWRLQQLLRQHSVEFRAETCRRETGRRTLLAPTPHEKHDLSYAMFCLVLMSEFFRRDGWEAWIEPDSTSREFAQVIGEQWFDVMEFFVGGDRQLEALAARIRTIRRVSSNRSIAIMVYGQVFIEHPELVLQVGADFAATDVRQGALQAQHLMGPTGCA